MFGPLLIPKCAVLSLTLLCLWWAQQVEQVVASSGVIDAPAKAEQNEHESIRIHKNLILNVKLWVPIMISPLVSLDNCDAVKRENKERATALFCLSFCLESEFQTRHPGICGKSPGFL